MVRVDRYKRIPDVPADFEGVGADRWPEPSHELARRCAHGLDAARNDVGRQASPATMQRRDRLSDLVTQQNRQTVSRQHRADHLGVAAEAAVRGGTGVDPCRVDDRSPVHLLQPKGFRWQL